MVRGTKHYSNLNHTTFTIFIDHCESNWVSYMESLRIVCWDIEYRSQVFSALQRGSKEANSDAIISETEMIFSICFWIFEL